MPTFSTVALENLLEPRVRDSYSKPPLSSRIPTPTVQGREIPVPKPPPPAPRHIYISPALYTTPEPAPIPETASEPLSPSPYVVNHKRRGGGVGTVGSRRGGGGFEIPAEEQEEEKKGADLIEEERVQDNFGGVDDELFGDEKVEEVEKEKDEEVEPFLDPRCDSGSSRSGNELNNQFDCRSFVSSQGEFFDAIEDFSSDTSMSSTPSHEPLDSEWRALRLSLAEEIERRKEAEDALSLMHCQWKRISDLLSEVGLTLPTPSNCNGSVQQSGASIEDLSQEVVVARFVAQAIGKGQARAEAEIAAEAIIESKDQEISRLRDKLQYYEAVNHEMSQRNQGIKELARKQRQRRNTRRKWFWSCIGVSAAIGISAVAYSYLSQTSKLQEVSSCSDSSDVSCIGSSRSA